MQQRHRKDYGCNEDMTETKIIGRPTIYTDKLALKICKRIAGGESLRKISEDNKMPNRSTIHEWVLKNEIFSTQYNTAINVRTENMFDELNDIADLKDEDESPMRSRLRVDTRKWYLSKIMPKKYGDKLDLTSNDKEIGTTNTMILLAQRLEVIQSLEGKILEDQLPEDHQLEHHEKHIEPST